MTHLQHKITALTPETHKQLFSQASDFATLKAAFASAAEYQVNLFSFADDAQRKAATLHLLSLSSEQRQELLAELAALWFDMGNPSGHDREIRRDFGQLAPNDLTEGLVFVKEPKTVEGVSVLPWRIFLEKLWAGDYVY